MNLFCGLWVQDVLLRRETRCWLIISKKVMDHHILTHWTLTLNTCTKWPCGDLPPPHPPHPFKFNSQWILDYNIGSHQLLQQVSSDSEFYYLSECLFKIWFICYESLIALRTEDALHHENEETTYFISHSR